MIDRIEKLLLDAEVPRRQMRKELAKACGISVQAVGDWFSGKTKDISNAHIAAIAKEWGSSTDYLITGVTRPGFVSVQYENLRPAPSIKGRVPLISWVQAGQWEETIDIYQPGDGESGHYTIVTHSSLTFALRIDGNSMTAPEGARRSFPSGMIIYVDPEQRGGISSGDFVIAKKCGTNDATFKQFTTEEGRPVLRPLNPSPHYEIIRDEFEIIGKVIDAGWGGV